MRRITTAAMAFGAILALGVLSAGVAQAHLFEWSGAVPSLVLALADGVQTFIPTSGGPQVNCKHATFHGKVGSATQLTQVLVGQYTGCTAFGKNVTVSPAEYELSADETVSVINKTITITAAGLCTVEVKPAGNTNLAKIRYLVDPNSGSTRILAHAEVVAIHSTTTGGAGVCGAEGSHTDGTYNGLLLAWVDAAGTLKWT